MEPAHVQQLETSVIGVVGWSPDERTFAWRGERVTTRSDPEGSWDVGRAVEGHTLSIDGEQRTWVLQLEGDTSDLGVTPDAAGFAPIERVASRHRAPTAGVQAWYEGVRVPLDGRWLFAEPTEELASPEDPRIPVSKPSADTNTAAVTWSRCAARPRLALVFDDWTAVPYGGGPVPGWIQAIDSPSGRWFAVVAAVNPYWHMRSGHLAGRGAVALVPAGFETQLLRAPGQEAVAQELRAALTPDWVVVDVSEALKQRERSVVYAAAGREEAAARLASRIPGGASVEPLTWEVPQACLVVALGASAVAR